MSSEVSLQAPAGTRWDSLSAPNTRGPISLTILSPFSVRGMSVTPVCRPFKLHSVSPADQLVTYLSQ